MYQNKKAVLVFGVGPLQESIIGRAKKMGLYTVGIDPAKDAVCRKAVDAFEVVGGQDYEGTCSVVERYGIDAIVTAATDKPLVMMARIAEKYGFPFFSVETAQWSTDKFQMKQRFMEGGVPCAKGRLVRMADETSDMVYPVIVKPRDNSGSRGVKLCRNREELEASMIEAFEVSKLDTVLVEEFIEGQEYSIEGLHYDGKAEVIQFTEKKTTEFPYNVELGHKQPANLTEEQKDAIRGIVAKIGKTMKFENCPSHTELKINNRGIFVIETSPRLGGDYITSTLVPLSTGINMEDQLLHIALSEQVDTKTGRMNQAAAVEFFCFSEGTVKSVNVDLMSRIASMKGVYSIDLKLSKGDKVNKITSSLNRYGEIIVSSYDSEQMSQTLNTISKETPLLVKLQ